MRLSKDPEHETEEQHEDGETEAQTRDTGNGPPAKAADRYRICVQGGTTVDPACKVLGFVH